MIGGQQVALHLRGERLALFALVETPDTSSVRPSVSTAQPGIMDGILEERF